MNKKWYVSKTLWANLIAAVVLIGQGVNQNFVIAPEYQAMILTGINFLLRLITKENVTW
jgi:hypothetical protein